IEPREGVEAFAFDVALGLIEIFETRHFVAHEAILDALKEEELVFDDWATESDARRSSADAEDFAVAPARPWQGAGYEIAPVVRARARFDRCHRAGKLAELR